MIQCDTCKKVTEITARTVRETHGIDVFDTLYDTLNDGISQVIWAKKGDMRQKVRLTSESFGCERKLMHALALSG